MAKVMILNKKNLEKKLIYMASNQKNETGTKCWLTCLFNLESVTILSNGGKLKNVLLFEMKMALKTTFRALSHWGSGLSIAAVYTGSCSIIIRVSEGFCFDNLYSILMYRDISCKLFRKLMEFLLFNNHRLREIYCLFQTKELIRTHHESILTLMNVGEDKMANSLGLQIIAFLVSSK